MQVEIIKTNEGEVEKKLIDVPREGTIAVALQLAKISLHQDEACGVFGEVKDLKYVLQEGDRVEIYWPLSQDPKFKRIAKVDRSRLPRRCR